MPPTTTTVSRRAREATAADPNPIPQYEVNRIINFQGDPFEAWLSYIQGLNNVTTVALFRSIIATVAERDAVENEFLYKLLRWGESHSSYFRAAKYRDMKHMLEEVDAGNVSALKACRHFVNDYHINRLRGTIREKWGSLSLNTNALLPPDLEPQEWSATFTTRLGRFVRTGIPRGLGEIVLRQSMQARIDAHKEKKVGWVDELTSADVLDTINRVFPAGTRQHLDLTAYWAAEDRRLHQGYSSFLETDVARDLTLLDSDQQDPLQVMSWAATDDSEHPTVRPHLLNVEIPETQAVPSSAQIESLSPTLVDEVARESPIWDDTPAPGSPQQQVAIRSPPVVVDLGDAQAPPSGSDDEVAVDNARTRPLDTRNQVVTSQSRRSVVASGHPIVLPDGRTSYRDCLRVQQAAQEATPDRMAQEFTRYANVNRLFAANLNQMSDNLLEAIEDEDELAMHEYANKIRNLLTRE